MIERTKILGTVGYLGAIPAIPPGFFYSFMQMVQFSGEALCQEGERIDFKCENVLSLHDAARNSLASNFQGDWLLQLDADISFEPDLLACLLTLANRYQVDVLCGVYCYKTPPHLPIVYLFNDKSETFDPIHTWDRSVDLLRVGAAGGGCLFVRRKVFERIWNELKERPFDRMGTMGEDLSFFTRLRTLDIPVYCAWKVQVGHLKWTAVIPDDHYGEVPPGGLNVRTSYVDTFRREGATAP